MKIKCKKITTQKIQFHFSDKVIDSNYITKKQETI